ncbi:bifunctional hydroxymethylpyrimidine kinase/phosphomethylpyrimidine kinase [Terrihabitans rhizophilus]|uniref:hydroxymethylpyrimidine kinase n=1 Tax=Terrihabitans rhizophilus TaxID=3092662 RepID=A0ABU4RQC8_9HYPH|nr:bifunctional hydroxymethylpyrimidine kinase/phosphomethylpyrimidine kinase [Terrihabitans sp. PJ23]MDX6807037.1 bifunctional hydroxymethylpyrimidine kinase/phosphomethylpyrimidine kinase [Terrihabitans sp. PJ23]
MATASQDINIALTIAGTDPTGGAGVQADLKTFSAFRVYGASVITALVAQNTQGVRAIHDVPTAFIAEQIASVFDDLDVKSVKIGMLSQPEVIRTVAEGLDRYVATERLVLDPVMVAASGDRLLVPEAIDALRTVLIPKALVITPNMPEAAALLDEDMAENEPAMIRQAERLMKLGCRAVLLKGGHGEGEESTDILLDAAGLQRYTSRRHATKNTHGTGCTLSSAIAAGLANGMNLRDSVSEAKAFITGAIQASDTLKVGRGHGPVHHFHRMWQPG